jgi:ABC-type multidrug transport system permease subunit
MERAPALREINAGNLSAVLIIPTNFMSDYLKASGPVSLELIKNPAESIHPAVLEEGLGVVVTALNALSRNFSSDFPAIRAVVTNHPDYHQISALIDGAGDKLSSARKYLNPPLVSYDREATPAPGVATNSAAGTTNAPAGPTNPSQSIFAYLLVGLAAMFLLFIAGSSMADVQREVSLRTFARFQTLRNSPAPFLAAKIIFTALLVLVCAGIILGGGGLIFQVRWQHPLALVALTTGYAAFMASWFALLAAILPDERRAAIMSSLTGMALGLAGGCTFPPEDLPVFLREHVTPLMPSFWFADTARSLQYGAGTAAWGGVLLQFAVVSVILAGAAALLFRRRFKKGLRA